MVSIWWSLDLISQLPDSWGIPIWASVACGLRDLLSGTLSGSSAADPGLQTDVHPCPPHCITLHKHLMSLCQTLLSAEKYSRPGTQEAWSLMPQRAWAQQMYLPVSPCSLETGWGSPPPWLMASAASSQRCHSLATLRGAPTMGQVPWDTLVHPNRQKSLPSWTT